MSLLDSLFSREAAVCADPSRFFFDGVLRDGLDFLSDFDEEAEEEAEEDSCAGCFCAARDGELSAGSDCDPLVREDAEDDADDDWLAVVCFSACLASAT